MSIEIILLMACASAALDKQLSLINAYAGTGNSGFSGDNGPATLAQFYVLPSCAAGL